MVTSKHSIAMLHVRSIAPDYFTLTIRNFLMASLKLWVTPLNVLCWICLPSLVEAWARLTSREHRTSTIVFLIGKSFQTRHMSSGHQQHSMSNSRCSVSMDQRGRSVCDRENRTWCSQCSFHCAQVNNMVQYLSSSHFIHLTLLSYFFLQNGLLAFYLRLQDI